MKCVILQPSYIPWRGYFDQINKTDIFVFYDDVQYDKHGWRNRNLIKTPDGKKWLSIPVYTHGTLEQHTPINQIQITWSTPWNEAHFKALKMAYTKAPHFKKYEPLLSEFYGRRDEKLADFNIGFTIALARELGIQHTKFMRSSEMGVTGRGTDRLLTILQKIGSDHYITGPAAKKYLEPEKFTTAGITLEYMNYDYPEYPQLYPPYDPFVSILDLLFMTGPDAGKYFSGDAK
jgi:hypothetical protein